LRNLIDQRQLMQQIYEKKVSVQSSEQEIVSLDDKLIQKTIQVVEENLEDPEYTIEKLSRELDMSRVHLLKNYFP
jgi:AraC-like DNA-binding protein